MITFKQYISEKVTKRDITRNLSDKNVICGLEYEFYFYPESVKMDKRAYIQYMNLAQSIMDARVKAKMSYSDYESEIFSILDTFHRELLRKSFKYTKIKTQEGDEVYNEIKMDHEEINTLLDVVSHSIKTPTYAQDVYDDPLLFSYLKDKLPEENSWVKNARPLPDIYSPEYDIYFDWLDSYGSVDFDMEALNDDIIDFILLFDEIPDDELTRIFDRYGLKEPPNYLIIIKEEWEDTFHAFFDNESLLPFKPSEADYYDFSTKKKNYKKWNVGSDQSLDSPNGIGCEIISPMKNVIETIKDLDKIFSFIKKYGFTDKTTSIHVNISYKGKKFSDFNYLKAYLFVEEEGLYNEYNRKDSIHAQSIREDINKYVKEYFTSGKESIDSFIKYMDKYKFPVYKYNGFHVAGNRIEFRYIGNDYLNKKSKVIRDIGKYIEVIRLGFDKTYKKKEYLKILTKLYNKGKYEKF